jgi:hypothetical protein
MGALPKKHLSPIATSLLFRGIFAVYILHGSSIATQHRKISDSYQNRRAFVFFLVNSITFDFQADIVRPIGEKKKFNDVQAV